MDLTGSSQFREAHNLKTNLVLKTQKSKLIMKLFFPLLSMLSLANADHFLICDKYTPLLFVNNTAENQLALITAVVDRAVLGNKTVTDPAVPGILAPEGGLLFYFTGAENTTNQDGVAVKENFLAGDSNTMMLLDHLYQFFGSVLGCTAAGFPAYEGDPDMFRVHKFMGISAEENDYFINQVGLSAASFGVSEADVMAIYDYLNGTYNIRCAPPLTASNDTPEFLIGTLPSICTDDSCPKAMDSMCPMDMSRSPMDMSRSPMDTSRSPMDTSRSSSMDTSRLPMDKSRSPMDTSRSADFNKIGVASTHGKKDKKLRTNKGQ
jgi:hypothetical protein